jgi:hypothetical protein
MEQNWIPITQELPSTMADVLCLTRTLGRKYVQFVGNYTKGGEIECVIDDEETELTEGWYECCEQRDSEFDEIWFKREVTHWMPLPEPPKE